MIHKTKHLIGAILLWGSIPLFIIGYLLIKYNLIISYIIFVLSLISFIFGAYFKKKYCSRCINNNCKVENNIKNETQ